MRGFLLVAAIAAVCFTTVPAAQAGVLSIKVERTRATVRTERVAAERRCCPKRCCPKTRCTKVCRKVTRTVSRDCANGCRTRTVKVKVERSHRLRRCCSDQADTKKEVTSEMLPSPPVEKIELEEVYPYYQEHPPTDASGYEL